MPIRKMTYCLRTAKLKTAFVTALSGTFLSPMMTAIPMIKRLAKRKGQKPFLISVFSVGQNWSNRKAKSKLTGSEIK